MVVTCKGCGHTENISVTAAQLAAWKSGCLIQKAFPNLNASQREMIMTQTCSECWDSMFPCQFWDLV